MNTIRFYRYLWALNATFNNISVISRSDNLYDEEIGVHGGNRGTPASHCQTLRHKVESSTPHHGRGRTSVIIE
jgi:hypothetical protein